MTEEEKRNIFLCGFMATGKSSVGKQLAAALHCEFLDMDALIEVRSGNDHLGDLFFPGRAGFPGDGVAHGRTHRRSAPAASWLPVAALSSNRRISK